MTTSYLSPLSGLLGLQRALASARRANLLDFGTSGRGSYPPINVFRDEDNTIVVSELPGVAKDDIDIQVHKNRIRLRGKKSANYGDDVSVHRRERRGGGFDRTITLPFAIDPDAVKAEFKNGILALQLSPPEAEKPRSISVS